MSHGWRNGGVIVGLGIGLLAFAADRLTGGAPGFGLFQIVVLTMGALLCLISILAERFLPNILLLLAGTAIGLATAELTLHTFSQGAFTGRFRAHPRYLYELVPGSTRIVTRSPVNGGQSVLIHINTSGYRGDELRPAGHARRIVVYGDSFIEGEFSDLDRTFARRLQEHLVTALATPVEVVNGGVTGYGPDQESLRMEDDLPRLQPDLVVVAIYAGNDFGDLLRNKLYTLGPGERLEHNAVALSDRLATGFRLAQPGGSILMRVVRKALTPLVPDTLPTDYVQRWQRQKQRLYDESIAPGPRIVDGFWSPYDIDVSTAPESPPARYQKALMRAVIRQMRSTAERERCGLLLLIIPSPTDLCEACGFGRIDSTVFPAYRRSALTDAVQQLAVDERVPYVSLFTPEWTTHADQLYFRGGDGHWNDRGQDLAAEMVSRYITGNALLAPRQGPSQMSGGTAGTRH